MTTLEIPRDQWVTFFDSMSRLHLEEPIRVEVLRLDFGAQLEVVGLPFDGIAADLKDGECTIAIAAGSSPDDHIAHLIADPLHVRVLRGPSDDDETLEIQAADQSTTLLFFEGPRCWSDSSRSSAQ